MNEQIEQETSKAQWTEIRVEKVIRGKNRRDEVKTKENTEKEMKRMNEAVKSRQDFII